MANTLSEELEKFGDIIHKKTGVYVLENGSSSLVTRAWMCENAEETIDIQYFLFSSDNVGLIACDFIVKAAERGVKVRILLDDIMVDAELSDLVALSAHPNIDIKIYNPGLNLGKNIFQKIGKLATDFKSANQRMHNKSFTVDGKVCVTGGRNVANEYFDFDHEFNFRDRDVLLVGKEVVSVKQSFDDYWDYGLSVSVHKIAEGLSIKESKYSYEKLHAYASDPENFWPQVRNKIDNLASTFEEVKKSDQFLWLDRVYFVADEPGKNNGENGLYGGGISTDTLLELLGKASSSIEIQTPYLVTTEKSRSLLKKLVDQGVKIRILTNSLASNDNLEAFSGYQRDREELLRTGVEIYEFKPDAKVRYKIMQEGLQEKLNYSPIFGTHAKTMVIDGNITVIGTFNFDPRSANLNTECITIIHSEKVSKEVLKGIETEFLPENSWRTTFDFNPDAEASITRRMKTWIRGAVPKDIL